MQFDRYSGASDQDPGDEDEHAADYNLKCCREDRRIHVVLANPGDGGEFNRDDDDGSYERRMETGDQERQCVPNSTECSHQTADDASEPRVSSTSESAIIGERFCESHADASANR